jgi:ABC-type branched-subunit amino acid transport system substrate-binding protein
MRKAAITLTAALAASLLAAGCSSVAASSSDADSNSTSGGTSVAAATAPGVTSSTISLGYLTDLSGPGSGAGTELWEGSKLYVDQLNSSGGVCGRQVKLSVQDDDYNPQTGLSLYQQSSTQVFDYMAVLGTPILSALETRLQADGILTVTQSWDASLLKDNNLIVAPSTSDMDVVALLGYLNQQGLLKRGDAVGAVYIAGLGEPQMAGVDYAASKLGLRATKIEVSATATDLTAQLQQFKAAGVKAIVAAGLPTQTAAVAAGEAAAGLDVPVVTGTAGFVSSLTTGAAAAAVESHVYVALGWSPFSADNEQVKAVDAAYEANKGGVTPDQGIVLGWAEAKLYTDIVGKTCGNLTRAGMLSAYRSISSLPMTGLMPTLDFAASGQPPARAYDITRPAAGEAGGLKLVSPPFITPDLLKSYDPAA